MDVPMCRNARNGTYNTPVTMEREAEINENGLRHFVPLVAINCSHITLLFVCLMHMPFCSTHIELPPLLPCRSVCKDVYFNCIKYYTALNLFWPQHLNCTIFPHHSTVCIKPPSSSAPSTVASPTEP
ncbi:frizzled-like [Orbicella faveolata]|uniref:frizzled-like n=1 Tax=Orbicella faveolata TaxID=48498 RepID=UPI0009E443D3|nr:frizzled-like [Orbicella faveolata]